MIRSPERDRRSHAGNRRAGPLLHGENLTRGICVIPTTFPPMSRTQELTDLKESLGDLIEEAPELESFVGFVESAEATETIDNKTKELLSLAISVVVRCDHCILWHTDAALEAGATHEEIVDALKIAVVMGGGPAMTYAVEAYRTLEALEAERAE